MTNLRIGTILSDGCACRVDGRGSGVDLLLTPKEQTLQSEARSCLEANVPNRPLEHFDTESGFEQHRLWERRLFDGGWSAGRPKTAATPPASSPCCSRRSTRVAAQQIRVVRNRLAMLAPTLIAFGTAEQIARHLPPLARGDDIWS